MRVRDLWRIYLDAKPAYPYTHGERYTIQKQRTVQCNRPSVEVFVFFPSYNI